MIDEKAKFETMLIGKTLDEAEAALAGTGFFMRVMEVDGEQKMGTCEARNNRINVGIARGVINKVFHVG